jgi:hypothetical protein
MLALCPNTLAGKRDARCWRSGAFRRSELVALEVADLVEVPDRLRVLIRRSKGDQEGAGQEVASGYKLRPGRGGTNMARCCRDQHRPRIPPRAEGPRRAGGAAGGVQCSADSEGVRRARWARSGQFSGNSLRSGFLTSAAEAGASAAKSGAPICSTSTLGRRSCEWQSSGLNVERISTSVPGRLL